MLVGFAVDFRPVVLLCKSCGLNLLAEILEAPSNGWRLERSIRTKKRSTVNDLGTQFNEE
jgi:hypothetical protein